ncbi:5-formyltetrahydrofolate cyclo-ligase [Burkholderiales bacterium]|nr:5-formyltetrahydrofolate cyclo-ligase [Burkholderiales bacterium]
MSASAQHRTVSPLRAEKRTLRTRILAARDALPAIDRAAASSAICGALAELPEFRQAGRVLLTLPFGSETDTRPLAEHALEDGKRVLLPRVDRAARMLELREIRSLVQDIAAGRWNIPEPRPELCPLVDPREVDWVLVPGVAFDRAGGRLGYGGGFYDRLLPLLRPGVQRVAGAFAMQLVERVPRGKHDLAVDLIVTEDSTLQALEFFTESAP